MPLYTFSHPESGEVQDVFFSMNDEKKFIDKDGVEWTREYGSPQLNTAASIDPWSSKDFVDKTNREGTVGDLLDRSTELSQKRAESNGGVDPVKENYYKEYSKKRKGSLHPDKMPTKFENKDIKIEI